MSNRLEIQDILRAEDVHRWTIVKTVKRQSLAEHTFNVIAIARDIAKNLGIDDERIIKYAFEHDLDEILTGDIPTPAKDSGKVDIKYNGKNDALLTELERAVVKIADLLEANWWLNTNGIGRHASQVMDGLIDRLNTRIALMSATHPQLQEAVGKTIQSIEMGKFEEFCDG